MTTMRRMEFQCPNCNARFMDGVLTSTNYGDQRTDFQRITHGANPLLYLIHTCQECGFTGDPKAFRGTVEPDVADRIKNQILPHVSDERLAADVRWEFAARIAEWRRETAESIGDLYLQAAWTAEGDHAKEMYYRRKAADYFEQALEGATPNRLAITYLIGELYRRVGESAVAVMWFDRAIAEADEDADSNAQSLKELALRQKTDPTDVI